MSNSNCRFEAGERDTFELPAGTRSAASRAAVEACSTNFSKRGAEWVCSILGRATTSERVMPPTMLFNEGWLIRLALDWFSGNPEISCHSLSVPTGVRWYSEALLPTQFAARTQGDSLAEKHSHADGVVGHFRIGQTGDGDLVLEPSASHFVVLEAKLKSGLSSDVKNAHYFDQAARSVACIAHIMSVAHVRPEQMSRLGFFVVAPASQIERGVFAQDLAKESIRQKVECRVAAYESRTQDAWLSDWFLPVLDAIEIMALSWEEVAAPIVTHDAEVDPWFTEFYKCCLHYNRLLARQETA